MSAEALHENLLAFLRDPPAAAAPADLDTTLGDAPGLTGRRCLEILEAWMQARWLDIEARRLKEADRGYYTIASAGHEANAVVSAALRTTDPAFLHYRSGPFFAERARRVPGQTPLFDVLLSLCAAADDPIAGGRHKVFGSEPLWIYPQTSTIASHLPKAMGHALSIDRAGRLDHPLPFPHDSVVVCSFGDASVNHSTALGALNAAGWAAYTNLPMPLLLVCEDNGFGISVRAARGWIESNWKDRPGLRYLKADGTDLVDTWKAATVAVRRVRERRRPVLLHLEVVRLLGHAGSDVELAYRDPDEIRAALARDPLLEGCRTALERGLATPEALLRLYEELGERVAAAAVEAARRPHLESAADVVAPLAPHRPDAVRAEAGRADHGDRRIARFGEGGLPEDSRPRHLAQLLNWGLEDLLLKYPELLIFGEDVGKRGGVYGVTDRLAGEDFRGRVFNTILDEQSILGLAIGAAQAGFLPMPEIQYLAYYHNAEDQVRGEASSLQFFSEGRFRNPMVVRIASWGYQRGFGGHFHNDNSIAALRDVPGVVVAAPARGGDAVGMLRTCLAMARVDGTVSLFLEPIALYRTRHLHDDGDDAWLDPFPPPGEAVPFRRARVYAEGERDDLTLVSWANGLWRSLRAARTLRHDHDVHSRIVDLRWLQPLDVETLCAEVGRSGRVLVVDEGRRTGGLSEAIVTALVEEFAGGDAAPPRMARYCGIDSFIPLGTSWEMILPDEAGIVAHALALLGRGPAPAPPPGPFGDPGEASEG